MSAPEAQRPLGLTDQQFTSVMNTAAQLQVPDRDAFLRAVWSLFRGRSEVGDGEFHRGCASLLREFWRPPQLSSPQPSGLLRRSQLKNAEPIA